jgi:hypothetical protein
LNRIELKDSIAALRKELTESIIASQGEGLRFEVGEVMLEFHVEVERSVEGKGGIKFWVVELGAGAADKDKAIHKVSIPLKPVRRDGKPVLTGSNEIPE